jgi:hypothetical protein
VGRSDAAAPHFEAETHCGRGRLEGTRQPAHSMGYVGVRLNLSFVSGRHVAELTGAWCLKPYWGKPTVRNFREGGWKRDYGSRTEAHGESPGLATGPYGRRVSALPDNTARASNLGTVFTQRQRITALVTSGSEAML